MLPEGLQRLDPCLEVAGLCLVETSSVFNITAGSLGADKTLRERYGWKECSSWNE
jgi:hypothetical protein